MTPADFDRFANVVHALAELHGRPQSAGAIALWWQALKRYDIEQIEGAFATLVCDPDRGQFMPKPADVVRAVEGTTTDRAALAWGKVMDAARSVGAWRDLVFDDPAIHAAIDDLGGWPKVCRTSVDELGFLQKRFADAYRAYVAKGSFEFASVLTGDANAHNRLLGREIADPVLVGAPELALSVQARGGASKTTALTTRVTSSARAIPRRLRSVA